ncbi:MAG: RHS repeat-associated core domain-containing protein [Gemmatimonadaceae bacterium]
MGRRAIDVEVSKNGEVLGGIEAKARKSRYLPWQMANYVYLRTTGYPSMLFATRLRSRTVWGGNQVLLERRADGASGLTSAQLDQETSSGESWGEVISLHGNGLDAPIAVRKAGRTRLAPYANWQGDYEIGTTADGTPTSLCSGTTTCPAIDWPGGQENADGMVVTPAALSTWWGSLISERLDASGMKYMRNRYYDPQTGQFTQQDPMGLAGGLNLYGFADGDPVNFSDPLGLCPNPMAGGFGSLQCFLQDAWEGGKIAASNAWQSYSKWRDQNAANCDVQCIAMGWSDGMAVVGGLEGLAESAARAEAGELSAAGRALEKHGSRTGSVFPRAVGNAGAKNAAGQSIVEDILTAPGSRKVDLTSGRFKGGFDIYAPDGRGVRYDASGKFITFLEPPR